MDSASSVSVIARVGVGVVVAILFVCLSLVALTLPESSQGLRPAVLEQMPNSGVAHPVTAVLLNFRGYDTLLEVGVLLLALMAVWSFAPAPAERVDSPGLLLQRLPRLLIPLMVLVAGYLLWRGAYGPGGAFQAGAILAAAGVLLILSGTQVLARLGGHTLRLLAVVGVGVFALAGLLMMTYSGFFLGYPAAWAGMLILLIEIAAMISIGFTLVALFIGGEPEQCA